MYVIQRVSDGKYSSAPGGERSYVSGLESAQGYRTREAAEQELCVENERVVDVYDILQRMHVKG